MTRRKRRHRGDDDADLAEIDASLLDLVDHVLTKGVVVTGDLVLGVADIDLVYLRLSAVLCAADRILGPRREPARVAPEPAEQPTMAKRLGAAKFKLRKKRS